MYTATTNHMTFDNIGLCVATIYLMTVSLNAFPLLYGCMYSNMLLVLHFPVCMFLTETRSPEEVATDTSGEEVFAHHDTSPNQHVFSHVSLDPPPPTGTDSPCVCLYTLYMSG